MAMNKNLDENIIGKRMLLNAVKMEETLSELLRVQLRILKKKSHSNNTSDADIQAINKNIKHIIFLLTLLDSRIETGLKLIEKN